MQFLSNSLYIELNDTLVKNSMDRSSLTATPPGNMNGRFNFKSTLDGVVKPLMSDLIFMQYHKLYEIRALVFN
jgi:hypothetical protein